MTEKKRKGIAVVPEFRNRLISFMGHYRLKQMDVKEITGVSQGTISEIKMGRVVSGRYSTIARLLCLIDGNPDDFYPSGTGVNIKRLVDEISLYKEAIHKNRQPYITQFSSRTTPPKEAEELVEVAGDSVALENKLQEPVKYPLVALIDPRELHT